MFSERLLAPLLASALAVGLGVVLHELGHKFFGQRFSAHSEFHSFDQWLIMGVLISFTGFLFVLPGAVFTSGHITKRQLGIIALAGPTVNFLLVLLFLPLTLLGGLAGYIGALGVEINALLAVFNMLPFSIFDGAKVAAWNKIVWAAGFSIAIITSFAAYAVV